MHMVVRIIESFKLEME